MPKRKSLKMLASAAGGFLDAVDINRPLVVFGQRLDYSSRND
jgi:hypothetical protein